MKEGREEGEGRKKERKKERRKEGRKAGRKEGRQESEGTNVCEGRKEGRNVREGRKEGRKEGRNVHTLVGLGGVQLGAVSVTVIRKRVGAECVPWKGQGRKMKEGREFKAQMLRGKC